MHQEIENLFSLAGRSALITGGARHLGYDAACILSAAGANVAITSRSLSDAQLSAERISRTFGNQTVGIELDQTNNDSVEAAVSSSIDALGSIDILVNNAGGTPSGKKARLLERQPEDIAELIELNLTGLLFVCRAVGRTMVEQGSGKIINIASIAGIVGRDRRIYDKNDLPGQPVDYAAAKAGVLGATRDLAGYLGPMGISVNAISPGGFERGTMSRGFVDDYSDKTISGRLGRDGSDLKGAILFLASPASDYVNGHNLVVDGGFSIGR